MSVWVVFQTEVIHPICTSLCDVVWYGMVWFSALWCCELGGGSEWRVSFTMPQRSLQDTQKHSTL